MTVHAHGFTLYAWTNRDISVTLSPERLTLEVRLAVQVCPLVRNRGEGGGGLAMTFVRAMMKEARKSKENKKAKVKQGWAMV